MRRVLIGFMRERSSPEGAAPDKRNAIRHNLCY